MEKKCDICEFLEDPQHQILVTEHWNVGIGNNHAYLGRAFASLRTHKGSLSELSSEEWQEFQDIVKKLEKAYKQAFGAEPLNWGCYMNNAFKTEPFNPHVHWHILPRYHEAPVFEGITFDDQLFGSFFDVDAERIVSEDVVAAIADKLRNTINNI